MNTILDVRDLRLKRVDRTILSGTTFAVARGGVAALMGPSGSGKTTILRAIAGLERFEAGSITLDDVTLRGGESHPAAVL
ncbi:MAG: ATP-binding cassette domain-containing protein, partial [Acidobacteria bacterium]|nr:ATP-binding cassette domain-containing protein [Acidobacteriota bacterium]